MFQFTEEDAVLVHETRTDGLAEGPKQPSEAALYVPTSRECWPLPAFDESMTPNQRRDFALACALASYGAAWDPTNGFDAMVLCDNSLTHERIYQMLNDRAG